MSPISTSAPRTWRLSLAREVEREILVMTVAGRLGTVSSGELIEAVVQAIGEGRRRILCDLGGVDYASSAGLLAFDALSGRMHEAGGRLVLCSLTEPVRLVFDLAGLLPHFTVEPTREAGIRRLADAAPGDRDLP